MNMIKVTFKYNVQTLDKKIFNFIKLSRYYKIYIKCIVIHSN